MQSALDNDDFEGFEIKLLNFEKLLVNKEKRKVEWKILDESYTKIKKILSRIHIVTIGIPKN